jgi:hypothetical protein
METPAHVYVWSIYNIAVKHSWLCLHLKFGDNVFKQGEMMEYTLLISLNMHMFFFLVIIAYLIKYYRQLCQWVWPKIFQKLIKEFMESQNLYKLCLNYNKPRPSGMSHNETFSLLHLRGSQQCLLDVNMNVI